jgi:hypothetical protein
MKKKFIIYFSAPPATGGVVKFLLDAVGVVPQNIDFEFIESNFIDG